MLVETNILIYYMSKTELRMRRYGRSKYARKIRVRREKVNLRIPDPDPARGPRRSPEFFEVAGEDGRGEVGQRKREARPARA